MLYALSLSFLSAISSTMQRLGQSSLAIWQILPIVKVRLFLLCVTASAYLHAVFYLKALNFRSLMQISQLTVYV